MKEIVLPSHIFMESTDTAQVDFSSAVAHAKDARRNANKVLSAALYIEREVEALIGFYLYPGPGVTEQQQFVAAHILGSDALTFAAKRRLIVSLVNDKKWLQGQAKESFERQLKNVMSFRNAFTHGNVIERGDKTVLKYFEGQPRERELNDAFWDEIVATFDAVGKHIEAIKHAMGINRSPAPDGAA
ncbi:MAG: hypothetical protein M3P12_00150 [Gemmatimonadota bacterium]|nr:hypothetical protein [Gemmatimonadota bacterium]